METFKAYFTVFKEDEDLEKKRVYKEFNSKNAVISYCKEYGDKYMKDVYDTAVFYTKCDEYDGTVAHVVKRIEGDRYLQVRQFEVENTDIKEEFKKFIPEFNIEPYNDEYPGVLLENDGGELQEAVRDLRHPRTARGIPGVIMGCSSCGRGKKWTPVPGGIMVCTCYETMTQILAFCNLENGEVEEDLVANNYWGHGTEE